MFAFIDSCGMADACGGGEGEEVLEMDTAVFAGVAGFCAAFVELVLALIRASGVADATCCREGGDGVEFGAAVFAVVFGHR